MAKPDESGCLTAQQVKFMVGGIASGRVRTLRGMSHLEAWDVRRHLIRVFGFEGFRIETLALDLVTERERVQGSQSRWTVIYRAQVRLSVYSVDGRLLTCWDDAAAGDSVNQPSLGDAHDMAMKTALSQAMKRCAVNLGDQFGLSLYNDGSREAVVRGSLAYTGALDAPESDPEVQPEQAPDTQGFVRQVSVSEAEAPQRDFLREAQEAPDVATVRGIYRDAAQEGAQADYLALIAEVAKDKPGKPRPAAADPDRDVAEAELRSLAAELGITDIDRDATPALGMALSEAGAEAIRSFTSQVRGTAP